MKYNANQFTKLMESEEVDIIVWGARGYPGAIRSPKMYGWIDVEESHKKNKKGFSEETIE